MTRLKALNDSSSDEDCDESEEKETIEAQEERAFSQYNKALELRHQGKYSEAEHLLLSLLDGDFLTNVCSSENVQSSEGLARPAVALKYACLKNLGDVLILQHREEDGLQCLIQAVELDSSDVTLWQRMGTIALQTDNFSRASHAFQAGLELNPRHWPCIDALLPVLYAIGDYLGCLVLSSRSLVLDPDYAQALALCSDILKEQPSLLDFYHLYYPEGRRFDELPPQNKIHGASELVSHAQSLRDRFILKNEYKRNKEIPEPENGDPMIALHEKSWHETGKCILEYYHSAMKSPNSNFLYFVKLCYQSSEEDKSEGLNTKENVEETPNVNSTFVLLNTDGDNEMMDVDSEHDAKGEDQTEEDATEASGHELEEDLAQKEATSTPEPVQSSKKRKQRQSSNSHSVRIDPWSKRRSGRRSGRKADDKEESNLASRFQSLLPDSLMPKDLEVHIAKASKKRSLRNPLEALAWADDSMDTIELCHFFQEKDAQDEHKRQRRPLENDDVERMVAEEKYFGKDREQQDVILFLEKYGSGTRNIIEVLYEYVHALASKDSLTWPCSLVTVYMDAFECMRSHFPYPSAFDDSIPAVRHYMDVLSSLLYCELLVDLKQISDQKDSFGSDGGLLFSNALGQILPLSCQIRIYPSFAEQCRIMARCHWVKSHLLLIQEDPISAMTSLRDVIAALELMESTEDLGQLATKSVDIASLDTPCSAEANTNAPNCSNPGDSKPVDGHGLVSDHVEAASVVHTSPQDSNQTQATDTVETGSDNISRSIDIEKQSLSSAQAASDEGNVESRHDELLGTFQNEQTHNSEDKLSPFENEESMSSKTVSDKQLISGQDLPEMADGLALNVEPSRAKTNECLQESTEASEMESESKTVEGEKEEDGTDTQLLVSQEKTEEPTSKLSEKQKDVKVKLPNARINYIISKPGAQKLLLSLIRQQQLSEVDELYKNHQYEALAGTLTECFKFCAQQADAENVNDDNDVDNLPDRPTQMAMLLDSLWQLKRYSDCFYWTEACLFEAFNRYLNCSESDGVSRAGEDQQMWATTIERLLAGLEACLKVAGLCLLERLPKTCLTRLVQTLTSILCQQLEQNESSLEMAIECVTPWVIMHRVIFFEEQHQPKRLDVIPSFMRVLFTAHEYMAKNSRCCLNDGILLNLILEVVVPATRNPELSGVRNKLGHCVEQAIFCLYGHPKKSKKDGSRKRILDHKVLHQPELTWERSMLLLQFYEPNELPSFDSGTKISADEEQLFLRISQLVPESCNISKHLSKIKAYVMGKTDVFPLVQCPLPTLAENLYYLIADYYLKTYKWEQAVKYYMLDVSINPVRFDSWAGMALARAALLTTQINSCDALNNDLLLQRKTMAQRCFQKAVDLDPEQTTMWIEYGNFAYILHSFFSRLLKIETDSLSMEMFTRVEEEKDKLLSLTETCFRTAEKLGQDERWLQQYMLGKVAEKRGEKPTVFLRHYRSAAKLLHESNAQYPASLNYDPPQTYAFEAHEVHYRIHASILKILESLEGKPLDEDNQSLFQATLVEAACSPFMAQSPSLTHAILESLGGKGPDGLKRPSPEPLDEKCKRQKTGESGVLNLVGNQENDLKDASFPVQTETAADASINKISISSQCDVQDEVFVQEESKVQTPKESMPDQAGSSVAPNLPVNQENPESEKETIIIDTSIVVCDSKLSETVSLSNVEFDQSLPRPSSCPTTTDNKKPEENSNKMAGSISNPDILQKAADNGRVQAVHSSHEEVSKCKSNCPSTIGTSIELDTSHLCANGSLICNVSAPCKILPGVGCCGGVDVSSNDEVHGMSSVVKEHDYAVPFGATSGESNTTTRENGSLLTLSEPSYQCRGELARHKNCTQDDSSPLIMKSNLRIVPNTFTSELTKTLHSSGESSKTEVSPSGEISLLSQSMKTQVEMTVTCDVIEMSEVKDVSAISGSANIVHPKSVAAAVDKKSESPSSDSSESSSSSANTDTDSDSSSVEANTPKSPQHTSVDQVDKQSVKDAAVTQTDSKTHGLVSNGNETKVVKTKTNQELNVQICHAKAPKPAVILDHSYLIKPCLTAMEECLVRYPRHYKAFYRLCHYHFRSKQHRNLKKCRQLLLGDFRIAHAHKQLNGLFKFNSIHYMFNDVWRIPVEEVDRPGSFASHMSRCVVLLMELLRDQRDHSLLLKLSLFLKKDPEKKDKKYLRDNERIDLSKQALAMCFTALRACVNQINSESKLVDLYPTVKEGIKELPQKDTLFKGILSDAFKKARSMKCDTSMYDMAAEFCQNELNLRKAIAAAKATQAAQAAAQTSQAVQAAAQVASVPQAAQLSSLVSASLYNTMGTPRYPNAVNNSLLRGNMASPLFLPKVPASRGRGRPPKAQRFNNPLHWLGLAGTVDQERIMQMVQQEQQRQRLQQHPVPSSSSPNSLVTDIAKDRPAISITAFPSSKNVSAPAPHVAVAGSTSVSTSSASGRATSEVSSIDNAARSSLQQGIPSPLAWPTQPRQPSPLIPFSGVFSPGGTFRNSPTFGTNQGKRGSIRPRGARSHSNTHAASMPFPQPRAQPYVPRPKVDPSVDYLLRLPGLQVEQRPQGVSPVSNSPKMPVQGGMPVSNFSKANSQPQRVNEIAKQQLNSSKMSVQGGMTVSNSSKTNLQPQRANEIAIAKQQLNQLQAVQKTTSQSVVTMKPSVSISKVFPTPKQSSGHSNVEDPKIIGEPNVDIITLD